MGKEIYNIINDMAEVLNASQMQKLQEVLVKIFLNVSVLFTVREIRKEKHILMQM